MKARPRISLRRVIYAGLGLLALFFLVWAFLPKPIQVEVAVVQKGAFKQTVTEDGRTRAKEKFVVSAPVEGRLLRPQIKAGDTLEQGALLAQLVPVQAPLLDPRSKQENRERLGAAEAEAARARSVLDAADAQLRNQRRDLRRTEILARDGFVPKEELEDARLELKTRERDRDAARATLERAQHEVGLARASLQSGVAARLPGVEVRSPVGGKVLRVAQESEAVVPAGTVLVELADPEALEVVVDVLSADAVRVVEGAPVTLRNWGGSQPLQGRVQKVEPSAFTKISALGVEEQRVNVIIDITSPRDQRKQLGEGYRLDADIVTFATPNAVKVPVGALFRDGEEWAVFVACDGRATLRKIRLGARNGEEALIAQGLEPGEKVILYPSETLRDQARIKLPS